MDDLIYLFHRVHKPRYVTRRPVMHDMPHGAVLCHQPDLKKEERPGYHPDNTPVDRLQACPVCRKTPHLQLGCFHQNRCPCDTSSLLVQDVRGTPLTYY